MRGDLDPVFIPRLQERGHLGIKCGLENIHALLDGLGRPDANFPVILIAGTNGKGSTGAFLAHMLKAAGFVVGWTTSPHLVDVTERIWVDGDPIGEGALELLLGEAFDSEARAGINATYFELMITAALSAFRMTGVEVALVEVGLGGRWDATNATDPILTVLTSVGLDHQQYLGDTREAIAREKLCTARDGRPLVLGPGLDPEWIRPLLSNEPVLCPAPRLGPADIRWDHSRVEGRRVGLAGLHQLDNLATAFETIRQLRELGFPIPEEPLWEGAAATRWPGRLWAPPGLQSLWMDGAHNPDGARALADHALACGVRPHLFFGAMGDKDLAGVARELKRMRPLSVSFIQGDAPRYAKAAALQEAWDLEAPLFDLREAAYLLRAPAEAPRLVTGSLYLLGDLLRELGVRVS
ncbi:bifunctional folylpolyglutamate synthase/dihydrofolate synthase [Geothrix edaphica]|uniref:Dihydrofolate synthase/folylpolyglutamate synthase n=1 Tax=Geothrix edaphica TaxID=2927976 RepID=A0ABQ5PZ58_9BACT|nr:Mur ligase family protein [Geothrix edaphica]GLH67573.1 bifunctional folylpolyglutamate synthase/dihydrofolate synthase [Geothrix edaphica]